MESHNIEILLDRYFEGETSLREETLLRSYFHSDQVAPHLQEYTSLFKAFEQAGNEKLDIEIAPPYEKIAPYRYIGSTAAAIVVGLLIWTQFITSDNTVTTSYQTEEIAILKTKQALGMMSQMINQSTTQLDVVQEFDNASSTLFK